MKCPTADRLSQYVDDLISGRELEEIYGHVKNCRECQRVVEAFRDEKRFIKEILLTPTLPDDFTSQVLDQLEPYEQKDNRKKRTPWKRVLLSAAGVVLALSVSATLNPGFADWIGGLFTTDQVDEGLRMATDAGLAERVNLEVMDNGMTFKVEDVFSDSSRVALSYQVINQNGKPQDTYLDFADSENKISVYDQNGTIIDRLGTGWQEGSDYGFIEIPLSELDTLEKIRVKFNLVELNGVHGNWQLEVPVDLTQNSSLTTTVPLQDAKTSHHGVTIQMNKLEFAPSLNEFMYETGFTQEEQARVEKEILQLQARLGGESVDPVLAFRKYGSAIEYHLENEDKETIYKSNNGLFFTREREPDDVMGYRRSGQEGEQLGQVFWNESFIPQQGDRKLTFVLDGVYKTVPSDFSVTFKPKELKRNPVSFEYEGNFITLKKAKMQGEYSLQKSLIPFDRESVFTIAMKGGIAASASDLGNWVLVDDKGNAYPTSESGSILNEKDQDGHYKTFMDLKVYGLDAIPEELTLHLVSVTRYEEINERWEVPLY